MMLLIEPYRLPPLSFSPICSAARALLPRDSFGEALQRYNLDMSVQEIQTAIIELPSDDLANLIEWIEEYQAAAWDRQIEKDVESGRFDALRQRVQEQRQAGQCRPL